MSIDEESYERYAISVREAIKIIMPPEYFKLMTEIYVNLIWKEDFTTIRKTTLYRLETLTANYDKIPLKLKNDSQLMGIVQDKMFILAYASGELNKNLNEFERVKHNPDKYVSIAVSIAQKATIIGCYIDIMNHIERLPILKETA